MDIKGIIFDLDGTLVDTLDDLTDSMNTVLRRLERPECSREQCREMIGHGLRKFAEKTLGTEHIELTNNLVAGMVAYYKDHCLLKTIPYPGMEDVIASLSKRGVKLAVLTNKNQAPAEVITRHYFGTDIFDPIVGAVDGRKPKPDPQSTLDIITSWGVKKEQVLFIGDSEADIQTAINAQIQCVGCEWGFRSREQLLQARADILIQRPKQILDLVA